MLRAQGKVLALIATILDRSDIVPVAEFGDLLAIFATITGDEAPEEGQILAGWAAIVKETADAIQDDR